MGAIDRVVFIYEAMIKREDMGWRNFHLQWWLYILHAQIINTYESQGSPENRTNRICIWKVKVLVAQSFPTLFDPRDWSLPGSSVHGILQASILEWVAIPFSRGSSLPRDWTQVSCIAGRLFTVWTTREALELHQQCPRLHYYFFFHFTDSR